MKKKEKWATARTYALAPPRQGRAPASFPDPQVVGARGGKKRYAARARGAGRVAGAEAVDARGDGGAGAVVVAKGAGGEGGPDGGSGHDDGGDHHGGHR